MQSLFPLFALKGTLKFHNIDSTFLKNEYLEED